jgi:hypothetical protein
MMIRFYKYYYITKQLLLATERVFPREVEMVNNSFLEVLFYESARNQFIGTLLAPRFLIQKNRGGFESGC